MVVSKRQIAAVMELQWPYRRHYEVFAGIQEYAEQNCDWEFHLGNFPEVDLAEGGRFDAVIGRITSDCFSAIEKARIPAVNVWIDSPAAARMPSVHVDLRSAGQLAAEHLFLRGLKRLIHFGFKNSLASRHHFHADPASQGVNTPPCPAVDVFQRKQRIQGFGSVLWSHPIRALKPGFHVGAVWDENLDDPVRLQSRCKFCNHFVRIDQVFENLLRINKID